MMTKPLRRVHVVTKTVWHCFIGLCEYVGVPLFLAFLSTYLAPFSGENRLWQWVERIVFCFTIYEVVLIGIRKMQLDTKKDSLLALKTAYERAALYCETGNQAILDILTEKISEVTKNGVLNQLDVIKRYTNLQTYIETKNTDAIKYEIICIQHSIETLNLLWNYTLFLRLFKG